MRKRVTNNLFNILEKDVKKSEFNIRLNFLLNKEKMPSFSYMKKRIQKKFLCNYHLNDKILLAKARIKQFLDAIGDEKSIISFSGGKDSCVLKHLVHQVQTENNLPLSNCVIASEIFHPETLKFIKKQKTNKDEIFTPIKTFEKIIKEDGYPIISKQLAQKIHHIRNTPIPGKYTRSILGLDNNKFGVLPLKYIHFLDKNFVRYEISHKCCDYIKGEIKHDKRPCFVGTTISESRLRKSSWLKHGCIHFFKGKPNLCQPISLFTENNIWEYINKYNLEISNIYKKGYTRSGCVCCGFGLSLEEQLKQEKKLKFNRFELLYHFNKQLFNLFFNKYKMWMPLADLLINLDSIDDEKILKEFNFRKRLVKKWYDNIEINLKNILNEIKKRNPKVWTKKEEKIIFNKYKKAGKKQNGK